MSSEVLTETFLYIGPDKISFCIFEGIDKKIFEKDILISDFSEKENLDYLIDKFFKENIIKIEKKINKFINDINLIIFDPNFVLIQASIKKNTTGKKINKKDLSHMLFDLKQKIKENNNDKKIIQMRINSFILDKKEYLTLDDNFECGELCLQVDFICLSNKIIQELSEKMKKYQINIDRIFSAKYLKDHYSKYENNDCKNAARLKYENDENEVFLIKKKTAKRGFFERFFSFFN